VLADAGTHKVWRVDSYGCLGQVLSPHSSAPWREFDLGHISLQVACRGP
jgi:hypothetical protein